ITPPCASTAAATACAARTTPSPTSRPRATGWRPPSGSGGPASAGGAASSPASGRAVWSCGPRAKPGPACPRRGAAAGPRAARPRGGGGGNRGGRGGRRPALPPRLFLADLFVHGIGGGKYDEITDELVRRFYGGEPPDFLVLSATLWLPVAHEPAAELLDHR